MACTDKSVRSVCSARTLFICLFACLLVCLFVFTYCLPGPICPPVFHVRIVFSAIEWSIVSHTSTHCQPIYSSPYPAFVLCQAFINTVGHFAQDGRVVVVGGGGGGGDPAAGISAHLLVHSLT